MLICLFMSVLAAFAFSFFLGSLGGVGAGVRLFAVLRVSLEEFLEPAISQCVYNQKEQPNHNQHNHCLQF